MELSVDFPNSDIKLYRTKDNALLEVDVVIDIKLVLIPEVEDQSKVFCFNNLNIIDAGEGFSSYL